MPNYKVFKKQTIIKSINMNQEDNYNQVAIYINKEENKNEDIGDNTNEFLSISEFIKKNNYKLVLGSWFKDIWFPLFHKKDVLITNEILIFMFKNDIDSEETETYFQVPKCLGTWNFTKFKENYKSFLIKNDIAFETIKYYETILDDYPFLKEEVDSYTKNNLVQKTWLRLKTNHFKESIMLMNNNNSKMLRKYYISLENILFDYSLFVSEKKKEKELESTKRELKQEYQTKLMLKEKENQDLKDKVSLVNNMVVERGNLMRTQIFYIATSNKYCLENIFKIGGVEHKNLIKSRFNTYNTERPKTDSFYYAATFLCHDYKLVENFISSYLSNFKLPNKKELFRINFNDLLEVTTKVVNQLEEYVSYFNCNQQRFIDNLINVMEVKENIQIRNYCGSVWLDTKNCNKKCFNVVTNQLN